MGEFFSALIGRSRRWIKTNLHFNFQGWCAESFSQFTFQNLELHNNPTKWAMASVFIYVCSLLYNFLGHTKPRILFQGMKSVTSFMNSCFVLVSSLPLISKCINFIVETICYTYFGKIWFYWRGRCAFFKMTWKPLRVHAMFFKIL